MQLPLPIGERLRDEFSLMGKSLSDLLFPPFCPLCEQELTHHEHLVCEDCFSNIHTIEGHFCQKCGAPREKGRKTCRYCKGKGFHLTKIRAFGVYAPPLSDMIHLLKYERKTHLASRLGIYLANLYLADNDLCASSAVIAVPLHRIRLRERGYNQSLLLARQVSAITKRPLLSGVIIRKKATRSQTALDHNERVANLQHAFVVVNPDRLMGISVTIIDDVLTSGSTMNEMAKTMLDAGANRVYGLVLARALGTPMGQNPMQ